MRSVVRLGAIIFMAAFVLFLLGGSSDGSHPTSVLRHPATLVPMAPVTSPTSRSAWALDRRRLAHNYPALRVTLRVTRRHVSVKSAADGSPFSQRRATTLSGSPHANAMI